VSTFDSPNTNDNDGNAGQVFDLIELPPEELEAAWHDFATTHIQPGRLLRLAAGLETSDDRERHHLEWCTSCLDAYQRFSPSPLPQSTHRDVHRHNGQSVALGQTELWPTAPIGTYHVPRPNTLSCQEGGHHSVPSLLRAQLHVSGPVVFGGNEVACESWQFGRLLSEGKDASVMEELVGMVVDAATTFLLTLVASKSLLLVCFGRAMHRCGARIAVRIGEAGFAQPHVVLAHDYYSPTIVCNDREFTNADVMVLMDVVHSGATLDGLLALCVSRGAHRVRGLVLVDQSDGKPLCAEWHSLWQEPKEQRMPLDAFVQQASEDEIRQLRRFEPNDDVALSPLTTGSSNASPVKSSRLSVDSELTKHIHDTGALKRDHMIGQKRYPYVINVLDLVKKSTAARTFLVERAATALEDLNGKEVAVAFHAGRKLRAGRLATLFSSVFGWPVVPIGSVGPTFTVSDAQLKQLATYDTVVIVDAALRTGDTLSALVRAIDDKWLRKHTRFVALCVLNALSDTLRSDLDSSLGIDIRTLFDLPLAPPTEEVRHWANVQKALIRSRMASSGAFANIEHVLLGYCTPGKRRRASPSANVDKTRELLEHAQAVLHGSQRIEAACVGSKPQFIRHLPVSEVVHDHNVQELLIGVMFNSVNASLKESAAFALASARNYEWMTLDWLKLNRPFIATAGQAWKSIVMVECEMKLSGRHRKLAEFRDATLEFREQEVSRIKAYGSNSTQLLLPNTIRDESLGPRRATLPVVESTHALLLERLDTFVAAAD